MSLYLLDTDIVIYYLKGKYEIKDKVLGLGLSNCAISEITVAELKYGIEKSEKKEKNRKLANDFIESIRIIPVITAFDVYAKEKVRLKKLGTPVDEFDLLIGCTAIANNLTLVTRNTAHFERLNSIIIENWVTDDLSQ